MRPNRRLRWVGLGTLAIVALALPTPMGPALADDGSGAAARDNELVDLAPMLTRLCEANDVPALAAAGIKEGRLWGIGVAGVRKAGTEQRATIDDRWHLGSCTKAMTATLAAIMVERGEIAWDSTIADVLPEVGQAAREPYRAVTLTQLLQHRSGLPEDRSPTPTLWNMVRAAEGTMTERRVKIAKLAVRQEPAGPAGRTSEYSNLGFVIAGAMLERAAGRPYEDLMRERVFEPLGMDSAGFGPPGTPGKVDQPLGHVARLGRLRPLPPTPKADNPAAIAPAGTVHCSIRDWLKFADLHLRGARGEEGLLLEPESFRALHTEMNSNTLTPMGWMLAGRAWAGGAALCHDGSNGFWYATIWIAPKANMAYVAVGNRGDASGTRAAQDAVGAMIFNQLDGPE